MDLPFVFNSATLWGEDPESADGKTAKAIGERWLRFAIEGNPGASSSFQGHFTAAALAVRRPGSSDLPASLTALAPIDPAWQPFTRSAPSWLAFDDAGSTTNESLEWLERGKLELHFGRDDPEAGEEVLGVRHDCALFSRRQTRLLTLPPRQTTNE